MFTHNVRSVLTRRAAVDQYAGPAGDSKQHLHSPSPVWPVNTPADQAFEKAEAPTSEAPDQPLPSKRPFNKCEALNELDTDIQPDVVAITET